MENEHYEGVDNRKRLSIYVLVGVLYLRFKIFIAEKKNGVVAHQICCDVLSPSADDIQRVVGVAR